MTEDYTNIENKNFSPLFLEALEEITKTGKTLKEKIEHAIEVGRNEGIPDLLIGNSIRNALSKSMGKSTIRTYLPNELKDQSKVRQFAPANSPDDDNNVIVETSIKEEAVPSEKEIVITTNDEPEQEPISIPEHKYCEERIARLEKEIEGLKEEIKRLETENESLRKEIEKPKIIQPSSNNPLFSSKTHEDYNRTKYMLKK